MKKVIDTGTSQAVPHLSTNPALRRLTSEFEWDPVFSPQYGRQQKIKLFCNSKNLKNYLKKLINQYEIRDSIVVSIPACHAGDPGSIPGLGAFLQKMIDTFQKKKTQMKIFNLS
ncbi:hypothetical protein TTHERM_000268189 (macronuclear) [Tetrahymena thermophila SB210]|uniref:Uncharacterized protein n=1 Tax=Tetrahymena thermophila (strain SB210) TaxID=312017 RepID=W7XAM4_TETTS|nr:hypothetical protein TTHERM_000268189 [Tetrahymena thermophila SB210]EWS74387.1 hypothetical protein TTHERM_000268189 [Tetrahymena thermophila SB210]|eukprot:XP_012653064.1 hypothetical protein TTHERM_000268189 [Tetrahymena thermophila SB210]